MLPISLTLKNFMSYGEEPTTIDFSGMDVVCLSGDNGHGKSAILDAITYALWGETRLGKQGHEQLIRLGADEMAVVFDFLLGKSAYRVRRARSRKSGGQIWEVQAIEEGGALRPLTGQGSIDTGRVIARLLRMNYDTFLNSVYLKQGRADEFVRQPPSKRKDILGEILDLSRYDELEALARRKARDAMDRKLDEERTLAQIDSTLADEPAARAQMEDNTRHISGLDQQVAALSASIEQDALRHALLDAQRREIDGRARRIASIDAQSAEAQHAIAADTAQIKAAEEILAQRERIDADAARLCEVQALAETLAADCETLAELQKAIERAQHSAESQKRELQHQIDMLAVERAKIEQELTQVPALQADVDAAASLTARIAKAKTEIQRLTAQREEAQTQRAELKARHDAAAEKLTALDERMVRLAEQADTCSVCGSPLTREQMQALSEQCEQEHQDLSTLLVALRNEAAREKSRIAAMGEEMAACRGQLDIAEAERASLAASEHRLHALVALQSERLPQILAQMGDLQTHLAGDAFARSERDTIAALSAQVGPLLGAPDRLREIRSEIKLLQPALARQAHLQSAQRESKSAKERIASAQSRLAMLDAERTQLASSAEDAAELDVTATALAQSLSVSRAQLKSLAAQREQAQMEHGRLRSRIELIEKSRSRRAACEAQLHAAQRDLTLLNELTGAFGKRGVQAMIIDSAMPELESDASALLERLTDGQMSLCVQTQRAAKSKASTDELIETLEIVVRDELGERALEMYSGGESFRVSFALRIALSKLLARRAGADLQTLVIDEGFGSQDASGREKLIDAIMAIRADFAQIMVITHVDELKDAFPNRIEVVKTDTGSQARLVVGAAIG